MPSKKPKTKSTTPTTPQQTSQSPASSGCSAFSPFADLVAKNFQRIAAMQHVFVTAVDPDAFYAAYLAAFPDGYNPVVKSRTEHDCATCRQFIRRVGNVVALDDDKMKTVWDDAAVRAPHPFDVVAAKMRHIVLQSDIADLYRTTEKEISFGALETHSLDKVSGQVHTYNHLYTGEVPQRLRAASPGQVLGEYRTTVQVFERGLVELAPNAVETVLGLIDAPGEAKLYRGEEHRRSVIEFQAAQRAYAKLSTPQQRSTFAWTQASSPAARFRNTVIGTLVQELSEGKDVDAAVRSFETKVAPTNYKRTSAVITPTMVKKAMETIAALGLEPALERRLAVIGDVSVRDVVWADGAAQAVMKGGIGDVLMQHAATAGGALEEEKRAEPVSIADFVAKVLPDATGLELLFKSEHVGNLMALTAPIHPEPKQLFKWGNDFAWSYCGNVADSIKERVKKAGGKVDGAVLRVSLSWFNYDDLDLHITQPRGGVRDWASTLGGDEIYFRNKRGWTGGILDVDMNAGCGTTRQPVENTVWSKTMPDGAYKVVVNNFNQRETSDPGFVVEVESAGKLQHFSYNKAVRMKQDVHVATLHMRGGVVERVERGDDGVTAQNISQEKWGLRTEQYVKVSAVTLSPNYWGENRVGNKHYFFVIEGAKCDEAMRGIYNEFLASRLEPHRKVMEIVGDKTKCQPVDGALAGLGFSSTKRDAVTVRVTSGKKRRLYNVQFGVDSAQCVAV